jgi:KipI family sensor histidine kinase inhibitor
MRYPELKFAPAGDSFIEVELGNEMSFDLNVEVHAFAAAIRKADLVGLIELVPELASLLVSYDPDRVSFSDLVTELRSIHAAAVASGVDRIESRLFEMPVLYFDPLTEACVAEYRKVHPDKLTDPEVLIERNRLADRDELVKRHSTGEYWAAALGFWPGLCSLMPLHPHARLTAPKYNPPRDWTPKGSVGLGGGLTSLYPDRTPGGYQIFGHCPAPTWDREQRLEAFREGPALFRPGDRVQFVPISNEEHALITAQVAEGSYVHTMRDTGGFSVRAHHEWLENLDRGTGNA